jgi:hypothetical protein
MDYFVIGADGKEYGPNTLDTIRQWAAENRVRPDSQVRNATTGEVGPASAIPGLFVAPPQIAPPNLAPQPATVAATPQAGGYDWSQPPSAYPRQMQPVGQTGKALFVGVVVRSIIGVVLFFVFHGLGLLVTGYAIYYAYRVKAAGSKFGNAALAVSCSAFALVALGWLLRLGGVGV